VSAARWMETRNMLQVAELVITAALLRRESRGSHWRRDYEALDKGLASCHYVFVNDPTRATDCPTRATARVRQSFVSDAHPPEEVIAHA
jgi:succinate dehydrogenase/fumarate reductase flavoprotein subunit